VGVPVVAARAVGVLGHWVAPDVRAAAAAPWVGVAGELRGVARGYTRGRGVLGTMRLAGGLAEY